MYGYFETESLTATHWIAVVLTTMTGITHVYVGIVRERPSLALAGVGFFAGLTLFLANYRRRLLYVLGIGYVVLQIVLWAVFNAGEYTAIGYFDKLVQLFLVGTLGYLTWASKRGTSVFPLAQSGK